MKWLLVMVALLFMVAPAMAGEDPYIGIVGNDCTYLPADGTTTDGAASRCTGVTIVGQGPFNADPFYFSPKHLQFMFDEVNYLQIPLQFGTFPPVNQYTRLGVIGSEQFRSQTLNNQAEVCDTTGTGVAPNFVDRGLKNAVTPAGNAGFYEWFIHLPKKPSGEINIVIQCGVLKPNAFAAYKYGAIELCAAETGERVGFGTCVRQEVDPGVNPLNITALPMVTAIAYPGPYNVAFAPFHLTAFKNPSSYNINFCNVGPGGVGIVCQGMQNDGNSQILDGSTNTRILLKACMDKTVVTKLPVTGQINALGETENDLEAGDLIYVKVQVPRYNSVDVYCHAQSARLAGVGESPY